jgi:hypothetical protein
MARANGGPTRGLSAWSDLIADEFDRAVSLFSNEMELREHVHRFIAEAIEDLYGLGITASSGELNTRKRGTRSPLDRLYGGVAVEWEWDMGNSRREHGADQALGYLANLRRDHPAIGAFTAVVSDGKSWGFLRFDPDTPVELYADRPATAAEHFGWYENSSAAVRQFLELVGSHGRQPITSKSLANKFGPSSEVARQAVSLLGQTIAGRTAGDRVDTLYVEWRRALDVVYGDLDQNDSALALDVQAAYRSPSAPPLGELLFVLHTYFALVGRVIAVELLAVANAVPDDAPSGWRALPNDQLLEELAALEAGRLPGGLEITNLFEADLFSWWAQRAEGNNDLLDAIRLLLKEVNDLAFPTIAFGPQPGVDVLRDLYQALVPNTLRKALGEFLTPHWLAEACLVRLREQGAAVADGRLLDPTCGTGTFLIPVLSDRLSRLVRERGEGVSAADVQAILDSVCGIDLNPIAVTATRVNYAMVLGELAQLGALTLPVWRADSLVVPESSPTSEQLGELAGIEHLRLPTSLSEPFPVPVSMNSARRIAALRALIEEHVIVPPIVGDPDDVVAAGVETFTQIFEQYFGASGEVDLGLTANALSDEARVAAELFERISRLSIEKRDGVWARLIENAYAPLFAGRFDVVVGNPPWLTWTKLPEGWRTQSESLWKRSGLWYTPNESGESFSFQSADLATLVFGVSIERYAKDGGHVGLLTPASLINADPGGRAFRQFRIKPDSRDAARFPGIDIPFRAIWLDDWSKIAPFSPDAANKPVFLIVKRGEAQLSETAGAVWTRQPKVTSNKTNWLTMRHGLTEAKGAFAPIDPAIPTSAWRFQDLSRPLLIAGGSNSYTFGTGLHTRGANGIFFVSAGRLQPAQGARRASVQIENLVREGRDSRVRATNGRVEADLVYPLLRGKDVTHWRAKPETYLLLPHNPNSLQHPLERAIAERDYPGALQWLKRHRDVLRTRKAPPARNWNMTAGGNDWYRIDGALQYMLNPHVVVVRELSSRPAAALVAPQFDSVLGRSASPLIDHKLMLCATSSREEALYLVAMINSTPMQDLLESFVNSIAVSPKSLKRLPIPDFDGDNEVVQTLVALAEEVVTSGGDLAADLQGQMDAAVLTIIAAAPDYKPQPARVARRAGRRNSAPDQPGLF